jgi:hypothetical protein
MYPKLLRAVDERLFVGPMGAILAPPPGLQWVGWVDLVEAEVRSEYPALVVFGLICLPARLAVQKWLPEGRLKRLLLLRITKR